MKFGGARPHGSFRCSPEQKTKAYFSELFTKVNLSFRVLPRLLTTAIMASEMPAAIRPYSIAVAPDSSDKKLKKVRFNTASFWNFVLVIVRPPDSNASTCKA